jgi:hypothetical protein
MAKKETQFMETRRLEGQRCECSAEISLPDYNTDVRKILYFSATPHHISSFASADALECSGEVVFDVIYLDFEGAVSSASFSGDYNFKVKCDTENYKDSLVETRLDNVSLRLMSPRKIAAKATLDSDVIILSEKSFICEGDALDEARAPQLERTFAMARRTSITKPKEREYADSLCRFDGKTVDDVQLLHIHSSPKIERVSMEGENCEISGYIYVEALIKTDDCPICKFEKKLELSEQIPLENVSEGAELYPYVKVVSEAASIRGDESGVELVLNIISESQVVSEENQRIELLTDNYLTSCDCENVYSEASFDEYLGRVAAEEEINEKIPFESLGVGKLRDVGFTTAKARIKSRDIDGDKMKIEGEILVSSIANEINNEEDVEIIPLKFSHEFTKNVNLNCQIAPNIEIFTDIDLQDFSINIDADAVFLHGKMHISCTMAEKRKLAALKSSNLLPDSDFTTNPARIEVYYPTAGESLYSIAKSHHTTLEKIAEDNPDVAEVFGAADEKSAKIKRLIIT